MVTVGALFALRHRPKEIHHWMLAGVCVAGMALRVRKFQSEAEGRWKARRAEPVKVYTMTKSRRSDSTKPDELSHIPSVWCAKLG